MSKLVFNNKEPSTLTDKIKLIDFILTSLGDFKYKELGFVSCFYNCVPTRILCPKCNQRKNRKRSRVFIHTKGVAHHLVGVDHYHDKDDFPTVQQSLKLVELYSIMLQMKVVGI